MNVIVRNDDVFVAEFVVGMVKSYPRAALNEKELRQNYPEVKDIEKHTVEFRCPNFRDHTHIFDSSISQSNGVASIRMASIRLKRLSILLKSWTFKDANGEPIPTDESTIEKLDPNIGSFLAGLLEDVMPIM